MPNMLSTLLKTERPESGTELFSTSAPLASIERLASPSKVAKDVDLPRQLHMLSLDVRIVPIDMAFVACSSTR